MSHSLLFIPADSEHAVELLHSDLPINVEAVLREHGEGAVIRLDMYVDDMENGSLHFLVHADDPRNERAEQAVVFMTGGMHIELTGNVCMLDSQPALIDHVVREFG